MRNLANLKLKNLGEGRDTGSNNRPDFIAPLTHNILLAKGQDDISQFDGVDEHVEIDDNSAIQNIFDGGGSVSCWFNPKSDGEGNFGRIFDKVRVNLNTTAESGGFLKLRFNQSFDTNSGQWTLTSADIPLNEWTHVVIAYDNSNVSNDPIFYINGVAKTVGSGITETLTPVGTRTSNLGNNLILGNKGDTTRAFDGQLENYQSYSKILSQAEVTELVNAGKDGDPLDDSTLINWYKFKDNKAGVDQFFDYSGNGNSGTAFGNTGEFARSTIGTVKDYNNNIQNCAIDEPRFQGARRIQNYRWSDKEAENAIEFDGVDDNVLVPDNADIQNIFDGGGTISCWINPKSVGENAGRIFNKTSGTDLIWFITDEDRGKFTLDFIQGFSGTDGRWGTTLRDIGINEWYHIIVTYDNSNVANNPTMYVNGVKKIVGNGLDEVTTPVGTRISDVGEDLYIGNSSGRTRSWDGGIDNFKMYDTELTATQVIAEYEALKKDTNLTADANLVAWWKFDDTDSSITDYSGNGNTGTFKDNGTPASPVNVDGAYDSNEGTKLTTLKGILIEEQRENEITYSEVLDNATGGWGESAVTPTLNFATSPDLLKTATKVVPDVGTAAVSVYKTFAGLTDNTVYMSSVFVKKSDYQWVRLAIKLKDNTTITSWFDIQNGVKGTIKNTYSRIESFDNGWYRISIGQDILSGATTPLFLYGITDSDNSSLGTGDGSKYNLLWGAQVEEGSFATSYVKTVASAVTRTKDVLYYPALNNVNESEGSMVCDLNMIGIVNNSKMLTISDISSNNRHYFYQQTSDSKFLYSITDGGVAQAAMNAGTNTAVPNTDQKIGGHYKVNAAQVFVDGLSGGSDASLSLPSGLTRINVGAGSTGASTSNATIKNVKIYKKKLIDEYMEAITN